MNMRKQGEYRSIYYVRIILTKDDKFVASREYQYQ